MKVLLVDDDPCLADDLSVLLPPHVKITWAPGSRAAIEALEGMDHPDAVIVDLCMPRHLARCDEEEGLELLSVLRRVLASGIPVVVLSDSPKAEAEDNCLARGACAYFEKPCVVKDLARVLAELTGGVK